MYREVPPGRMILALVVVLAPLFVLEQQGNSRWAWGYALLILLGFAVYNYPGLARAANWASRELAGG
jgi:hypothetical protein